MIHFIQFSILSPSCFSVTLSYDTRKKKKKEKEEEKFFTVNVHILFVVSIQFVFLSEEVVHDNENVYENLNKK